MFAYSAVEAPQVYHQCFQPLMDALAQARARRWCIFRRNSPTALIEAMRSGRLHVADSRHRQRRLCASILAGAVPIRFAGGTEKGIAGYHISAVVRADSPYKTLADLKGKRVAHTTPSSNSGNLAPRVFFPPLGLVPDTDYKPAHVGRARQVGARRVARRLRHGAGRIRHSRAHDFARRQSRPPIVRVIYESQVFPTASFSITYDLKPELSATIRKTMLEFKFPEEMQKQFNGTDRFLPINYKETWAPIREIAEKSGTPYNKSAFDAQAKREADAAAKKQAEEAQKAQSAAPAKQ